MTVVSIGACLERRPHLCGQVSHGRGDDGEVGAGDRILERARGLVDRAARARGFERRRVGVVTDDLGGGPGLLGRERNRGPDQARADHRQPSHLHGREAIPASGAGPIPNPHPPRGKSRLAAVV